MQAGSLNQKFIECHGAIYNTLKLVFKTLIPMVLSFLRMIQNGASSMLRKKTAPLISPARQLMNALIKKDRRSAIL